jgi:hypothetical protein
MHFVTPVIEGAERSQERPALTVLEDAIAANWTVAAGLGRALPMLRQHPVELLSIADDARQRRAVLSLRLGLDQPPKLQARQYWKRERRGTG